MMFTLQLLILYVFLFLLFFVLAICLAFTLFLNSNCETVRYEEEYFFTNSSDNSKHKLPSITEKHSVDLSVIVPAYNEEERLPPMLDEAIDYLNSRQKDNKSFKYEIIVVSDASKDKTVDVVHEYSKKNGYEKVRCLNLIQNRGKGGAVRLGVLSSRGATILFADADGATKFPDLIKVEAALNELIGVQAGTESDKVADSLAISIGSRAHLEQESLATRSFFRNILMYGFHFLVWLFTVRGIKDTQCGFKLFTREAARVCFNSLHVERWAFDVELLYIAQKLKIPIAEVSVRWTEIDGSKVTPVWSWIQMGCDLGLIWIRYTLGVWKLKELKTA